MARSFQSVSFPEERVKVVLGDVERESALVAALQLNIKLVINCAGVYAWWLPDPDRFERVNVEAAARKNAAEPL